MFELVSSFLEGRTENCLMERVLRSYVRGKYFLKSKLSTSSLLLIFLPYDLETLNLRAVAVSKVEFSGAGDFFFFFTFSFHVILQKLSRLCVFAF